MKTKFTATRLSNQTAKLTPKKFLLGTLFLILSSATPILAATCQTVATFDQFTTCTMGPGDIVTFSNFTSTLPGSTVVGVSLNSSASPGSVGFNLSPIGGSAVAYTFSYLATCSSACLINGASDSSSTNPAGGGTYNFTAGAASSGNITGTYNVSFPGVNSVLVTGSYIGGGISQSLTLDVNFIPNIVTATPEPASFIFIGSALVALGLVARGRQPKA